MKRAIDVLGATLLLVVLSPLFVLVSLAVKASSKGPVLCRRRCKGYGGRPFTVYAFRTVPASDGPGGNNSLATDLGGFLRASAIDRLPQLVNVVRGEMSLVGVALDLVTNDDERSRLVAGYAFRHHVKPGLIGSMNAEALRKGPSRQAAEPGDLGLWYVDNWSLWLDARILMQACLVGPRRGVAS